MRVLGKYVLVEQQMISKKTKIVLDAAREESDKFDFKYKILQVGPGCERDIKEGDIPIFAKHVQFQGVNVLERTDTHMTVHVIVYEEDIVGLEND